MMTWQDGRKSYQPSVVSELKRELRLDESGENCWLLS
jgi:hypothetical protein